MTGVSFSCKSKHIVIAMVSVRIDGVPDQFGDSENGLPGLSYALQMIILNLYLKRLGCYAAHLTESTSACCSTVCTAAS